MAAEVVAVEVAEAVVEVGVASEAAHPACCLKALHCHGLRTRRAMASAPKEPKKSYQKADSKRQILTAPLLAVDILALQGCVACANAAGVAF